MLLFCVWRTVPFHCSRSGSADITGKTSITQQFVTPPTYNDQYYPTIEATSNKTVKYKGVEYDCEIVDTAGQVSDFVLVPC